MSVDEDVGGAAHVARAVGERELGPERLDLGDVVDDRLDLARASIVSTVPTQLARRRVERLEPTPIGRATWLRRGRRAACVSAADGRR